MEATNAALGEISMRRNLCTSCGAAGAVPAAAFAAGVAVAFAAQAAVTATSTAQAMRKARGGPMLTLPVLIVTGLG